MDSSLENVPSTSQSTPKDDTQMSEDAGLNLSIEKSSNITFCEAPEKKGMEDIRHQGQELVENINRSRNADQTFMDDYQEKFVEKVTEMCQRMKGHMYMVYEQNSDEMQVRLQELSKVLENCSRLQNELLEASQALARLREDLTTSHKSE
ncbi:synaptonemal complex central element protein 2 isoform X2 [Oryzias melastigma]|uniref:synaptonemal complex central element protein 2 isoform X2 n=1 Tax=Oryzias melastigma TaxID=30732 RepID=UPI000CF7FA6D|nr:synaptonemal complex central element protein 2 isoform X2 [Oryzias melastigma]